MKHHLKDWQRGKSRPLRFQKGCFCDIFCYFGHFRVAANKEMVRLEVTISEIKISFP